MSLSISAIGVMLALSQPATHLSIQPWTGSELQTTSAAAAKYRLKVTGAPESVVHLQASGVAPGWLAAFCTPKFCSPQRIDVAIPSSGEVRLTVRAHPRIGYRPEAQRRNDQRERRRQR